MGFEILIPTYNRPSYLKRILSYYDSFDTGFKIIVADSSVDKYKIMNRDLITSVENLNIKYLDHYLPSLNPHHKLALAVQHVRAKYCVFCADDDFVIPNGIEESIKFLDENPDYICAHGRYMNYSLNHNTFYWKDIYPDKSINIDDPIDRLYCHFQKYCQILYSTHRTLQRKVIYNEFLNTKVDPVQFGELLPNQLSIILGKMKKLDVLYMMREAYSRVGGYWPSPDHWPSLIEYIENAAYKQEYEKFKICLAIYLSREANISFNRAMSVVHHGWQEYLDKAFYENGALLMARSIGKLFESLNLLKLYNFIFQKFNKMHRVATIRSWNVGHPSGDFNKVKECVINNEIRRICYSEVKQ